MARVIAGVGNASLNFGERSSGQPDLDQSSIHFVLGGGFRWRAVELEVRDNIIPLDLGPEETRLAAESFDGRDRLQIWQVNLNLSMNF